jgi:hypothetical protein
MTQPASPSTPSGPAVTSTNEGDRSRATKTRQVHPLPTALVSKPNGVFLALQASTPANGEPIERRLILRPSLPNSMRPASRARKVSLQRSKRVTSLYRGDVDIGARRRCGGCWGGCRVDASSLSPQSRTRCRRSCSSAGSPRAIRSAIPSRRSITAPCTARSPNGWRS